MKFKLVESIINEVYPNKGESKKDFISRFMSVTKDEYPDIKQRYAVANSYWERRNKKKVDESNLNESKKDIEKFRQWAGQELADRFFKQKNRLKGKESDIYYWMGLEKTLGKYVALGELKFTLRGLEEYPTSKERNRLAREGSEKIYEDSSWLVLRIDTYEASKKYGKSTSWCISSNDDCSHFDNYSDLNDIYFYIDKKTEDRFALVMSSKNDWTLWTSSDCPICGEGSSYEWASDDNDGEIEEDVFDTFNGTHPDFPNVPNLPDINKCWDESLKKYEI